MTSLRLLQRLAFALLLGSFAVVSLDPAQAADDEAIVFLRAMRDMGTHELSGPYGVAVDDIGNVYVADMYNHRIVKFDPEGQFKTAFGTYGSGPGNLNSPQGVAIGALPGGGLGVYVAELHNHRISVFTTGGSFVRQFGTEDGEIGPLRYPAGIAALIGDGGAGVYVADSGNNRIVRFSLKGKPLQAFSCNDCPNGGLQSPAGIGLRKLRSGDWQVYVVDQYGKQVDVLNSDGTFLRSFGEAGAGNGGLGLPDDIAVDPDGSVYVIDPAFNDSDPALDNERATRFTPSGKFSFLFESNGIVHFNQPHGIALDQRGHIYVADTGNSDVYEFALKAPKLSGLVAQDSAYWIDAKQAMFLVRYNGLERTCDVNGAAQLTVPTKDGDRTFTLKGNLEGVGSKSKKMKMAMSARQANWLDQANPGKTKVVLSLSGRCGAGLRLTSKVNFKV